ncbi:hypothetical protein Taro_052487 [Colocasia esculenta]|uniref:Aminotransferase-like plant mobile domain-containing protein n=1 Tax=Colocasia esculenta TaxID=4460 RepID=A0A843XK12_COLES|nr:hypothetical protein [Colocasia esculenta]
MAMKRAPLDPMGGEAVYEGPKRARAAFEALMRITDVPNHLSRSEEVRELFPGSRRYSKLTWIAPMIKSLPMYVIRFLREWGLGGVLIAAHNYHKISFDWHSITALIELWHPQTHTFIFPKFEATVLLEEVEAFLALPKTKPGDEQNISYTVEPINPKLILGEFMTDPGDVHTMVSPQFIHLVPLSKWVISKCKDKSVDHHEIAKAAAICLCGVVLFPSVDHLIDYASLSAISGVWRGFSLSHAVLAYLYSGLTSASTGGFLYGFMIRLECWLGVRIKFKPVDNPTTDSRIFGCHPLNFIGGAAKFSDKVLCRTADKKTRSAWRLYFKDARAVLAEEEGEAADRDLRRFLILVIGKLILGTRGDPVGCRCLPLLEDLSSVGNYAWGVALLAHLFDSLGTSSRETGVAGFFPLLQVWVYDHLPSLGRGVARRCGAVPLLQRWRFCRDERSLRR